jgi:hypothetical protein
MKVKNLVYFFILYFNLISQIHSLTDIKGDVLHEDHELPIICSLEDGGVLAMSRQRGSKQQIKISRFDRNAEPTANNETMDIGISGSSELIQIEGQDNFGLFYHNNQNIYGRESKENLLLFNFKDSVTNEKNNPLGNYIYKTKSAVSLKNGKIFLAGIVPISTSYAQTSIQINLFDPSTERWENGFSFNAHSHFISCYEQRENNIYCAYVSYDDIFIRKLKIKHIVVNDNTLIEGEDKVIKTYYTDFNFLKAIPFNENEALILFSTINDENKTPQYTDLYFYQIELSKTDFIVATRYEHLNKLCKYSEDPEDYYADIYPLSKNRIYAICVEEDSKFKGFEINPGVKEIVNFYIKLSASQVKNPVFAKFGQSLGIFYNHIESTGKSKVNYFLINYPDCIDYRSEADPQLVPKRFNAEIDLKGRIFFTNPLPFSRANEKVNFRVFPKLINGIYSYKTEAKILNDTDYDKDTILKVKGDSEGKNSIEFIATREDPLDGLIFGRKCNIHLNTPKCLDRCYSCSRTGTNEHHYCLGCAEGPYYEEKDDTTENEGFGKPHNCPNCDIACATCRGPLLPKTTNCIRCDYEHGFYHYQYYNDTCISYDTQEKWEKIYNHSMYLDDSPGEEHKELWRWRHCHENCKKCHRPGTNEDNQCDVCIEDYYFYCNQTLGHGIPGSCHNDCINNGFYLHKNASDNMDKCCPCLDDCKLCTNDTICNECYEDFYKTPKWDMCNRTCDPCLAYDDELKECVYCKDRYKYTGESPRYNYHQKCYYPMPEGYHLIDDICYNITICDGGCFTCEPEGTDQCTKCKAGFFKEDFFGLTLPKDHTFRCFNKNQCHGIEKYWPNEDLRIGGVCVIEEGEGVCLNCRLRNNSFRLPENNFYCGEKIKKTFVDIPEYNKLTECYFRCKECDSLGNSCFMNCSSCLDKANYDIVFYDAKNKHGNCYRKAHKCGIYPYYHDYDLAGALNIDEDNCGEACDVCLYNFRCPEKLPFLNIETHECVEYCPVTQLLSNKCNISNTIDILSIIKNPFGTNIIYLKELIKGDMWNYFSKSYGIEENIFINQIINNLGTGQIINLPESKIIFGNNISIKISTVKLEEEEIKEPPKPIPPNKTEGGGGGDSILNISECEILLKKKYDLSEEEDLIIFTGSVFKNLTEYLGQDIQYQLFSTSLGAFLPLSDCEKEGIPIDVSNVFDAGNFINLDSQFQSKISSVVSNGYDVFDSSSPFYNDICSPFTNENGNDVLLEDRRTDYFNENLNLCDKGCTFKGYNLNTKRYTCRCPINPEPGVKSTQEFEEFTQTYPESFYKRHKHSNIEVFLCPSQVFSAKGQKGNYGSYCLLACLASFIGIVVFYFIKGKEGLNLLFKGLLVRPPASPPNPKKIDTDKRNYDEFIKKKTKPNNIVKDIVLEDEELNSASFDIACKQDYRNYLQCYWSLLKMKQLFIFTFYTYKDRNLRIAKIILFILFISFYFAFTALFFNDNIISSIYIYEGNTKAAVHIPNIILSSLCCLIMNFIVRFVSLNDRDMSKIHILKDNNKREALCKKTLKCIKIKLYILFAVSAIIITLCWYYVAAFCAVFKNSQGHYFINLLLAFIICNIWPCLTSLIAPIIRVYALKNVSKCMYIFSQIISYI